MSGDNTEQKPADAKVSDKKAVGKKQETASGREDRLAEALRANLRRRKVAAKTRNKND